MSKLCIKKLKYHPDVRRREPAKQLFGPKQGVPISRMLTPSKMNQHDSYTSTGPLNEENTVAICTFINLSNKL